MTGLGCAQLSATTGIAAGTAVGAAAGMHRAGETHTEHFWVCKHCGQKFKVWMRKKRLLYGLRQCFSSDTIGDAIKFRQEVSLPTDTNSPYVRDVRASLSEKSPSFFFLSSVAASQQHQQSYGCCRCPSTAAFNSFMQNMNPQTSNVLWQECCLAWESVFCCSKSLLHLFKNIFFPQKEVPPCTAETAETILRTIWSSALNAA